MDIWSEVPHQGNKPVRKRWLCQMYYSRFVTNFGNGRKILTLQTHACTFICLCKYACSLPFACRAPTSCFFWRRSSPFRSFYPHMHISIKLSVITRFACCGAAVHYTTHARTIFVHFAIILHAYILIALWRFAFLNVTLAENDFIYYTWKFMHSYKYASFY